MLGKVGKGGKGRGSSISLVYINYTRTSTRIVRTRVDVKDERVWFESDAWR